MSNTTTQENTTAKTVILAGLKKMLTKREPSLKDFIKQHQLRSFRSKHCKFAVRVSVITKEGREIYAYGNTMHDGFLELKRKFASV